MTFHIIVIMSEIFFCNVQTPTLCIGVITHQLGARGLGVVAWMVRVHALFDKAQFPLEFGIEHRALQQLVTLPLKSTPPIRSAQYTHVGSATKGSRA